MTTYRYSVPVSFGKRAKRLTKAERAERKQRQIAREHSDKQRAILQSKRDILAEFWKDDNHHSDMLVFVAQELSNHNPYSVLRLSFSQRMIIATRTIRQEAAALTKSTILLLCLFSIPIYLLLNR